MICGRKRGPDPIDVRSVCTDVLQVPTTIHRSREYSTRVTRPGRGEERRAATIRKAPMEGIDMKNYKVDAAKVADAIVRRLLDGNTLSTR